LDTFRSYGQYGEYAQGSGLSYSGGAHAPPPSDAPEYAPPYEASKLPGYGQSYAESIDLDKKATDEEKDLAGVSR
jgi:hypothetical protein